MKIIFSIFLILILASCTRDRSPLESSENRGIILETDREEYELNSFANFTLINQSDSSAFFARCGVQFVHYLEHYKNDIWIESGRRRACRDSLNYFEIKSGQTYSFGQKRVTTLGKQRLRVNYSNNLVNGPLKTFYSNEFIVK